MSDEEEILRDKFGDTEGGDKASGDVNAMIRAQGQGSQMAKYLVDVTNRTQLIELLMRTVFYNREELLLFNDYCAWCEDFGVSLENATRYAAARPSVGGLGRNQLVDALTVFKTASSGTHRQQSSDESKKRNLPP